jgi:hypothetical protein
LSECKEVHIGYSGFWGNSMLLFVNYFFINLTRINFAH